MRTKTHQILAEFLPTTYDYSTGKKLIEIDTLQYFDSIDDADEFISTVVGQIMHQFSWAYNENWAVKKLVEIDKPEEILFRSYEKKKQTRSKKTAIRPAIPVIPISQSSALTETVITMSDIKIKKNACIQINVAGQKLKLDTSYLYTLFSLHGFINNGFVGTFSIGENNSSVIDATSECHYSMIANTFDVWSADVKPSIYEMPEGGIIIKESMGKPIILIIDRDRTFQAEIDIQQLVLIMLQNGYVLGRNLNISRLLTSATFASGIKLLETAAPTKQQQLK